MKKKTYNHPCIKIISLQARPFMEGWSVHGLSSPPGTEPEASTSGYVLDGNWFSREINWFDDGYDDEDY